MTEQEKRKTVNHFLTLFIEECWHEWIYKTAFEMLDDCGDAQCSICGKWQSDVDNYNFYTPNDWFHLKERMEKKQLKLWRDYLVSCPDLIDVVFPLPEVLLKAQLDPSNLFEFLVRERARWENIQDESRVVGYQHKAAVYLDSLEGK